MVKKLLIVLLALGTCSAYAQGFSYFEDVTEEFCADKKIDYRNDSVYCKASNSQVVIKAKVGATVTAAEYKKLGFYTFEAVEAGMVPDDSSHTAYFYTRWLLDGTGKKVGIITIEGWTNSEMETAARFDVRYNLKGEVVMASAKSI